MQQWFSLQSEVDWNITCIFSELLILQPDYKKIQISSSFTSRISHRRGSVVTVAVLPSADLSCTRESVEEYLSESQKWANQIVYSWQLMAMYCIPKIIDSNIYRRRNSNMDSITHAAVVAVQFYVYANTIIILSCY